MRTRIQAILLLATVASPAWAEDAATRLIDDLRSSSATVRARAVVRLGQTGDRNAVPELIKTLADSSKKVRREAAKSLGAVRDTRAVKPLIEALADSDPNVRAYAADALGEIRDGRATEALLGALRDPAWSVREQATWALRAIGDGATADGAIGGGATGKGEIGPRLVELLREKAVDPERVLWLLKYLADDEVVRRLPALLEAREPFVRRRGIDAVVRLGGKDAFEPLVAALADEDPGVRLAAVRALTDLEDPRAKEPLARLVKIEKNARIRETAREAVLAMSIERRLAAYWSFDDGNTRKATDVTRRGNDGTIRGCEIVEGKVGQGLKFGPSGCVELNHPRGFNIAGAAFTVMAWIKSEAPRRRGCRKGRGVLRVFALFEGRRREVRHPSHPGRSDLHRGRARSDRQGSGCRTLGPSGRRGLRGSDRIVRRRETKVAVTKTPGFIPGNCGQGMEIGFDAGNSPVEICDHFQGVIDEVKAYHAALSEDEVVEQSCLRKQLERKQEAETEE